jgi:hypothetical protein
MDIDKYREDFRAKIDSLYVDELIGIFENVLDGYEKPIPLMAIPVVVPSLSTKRTFILVFRRCNMYRKRGKLSEICRNKRK